MKLPVKLKFVFGNPEKGFNSNLAYVEPLSEKLLSIIQKAFGPSRNKPIHWIDLLCDCQDEGMISLKVIHKLLILHSLQAPQNSEQLKCALREREATEFAMAVVAHMKYLDEDVKKEPLETAQSLMALLAEKKAS